MTNLPITIIGNSNLKVSATNLCYHSMGKLGMTNVKQKRINKKPEETFITSPAMIVDKNVTIQEK